MNRRWACPKCGRGANAPERMRRDDVRRYCLSCSKSTGRLVMRACAVLERARVEARAARTAAAQRQRQREGLRWTVCGLDVRTLARDCWRAVCHVLESEVQSFPHRVTATRIRERRDRPPEVKLRRRRGDRGTSGYGEYSGRRITLIIGNDCDPAKLMELTLHEVCHGARLLAGPLVRRTDACHGDTFNRLMTLAAFRLWGVPCPILAPGYATSRELERRLREKFNGATAAPKE